MSRKIVKSFIINGNDDQIFEVIKNYLPALKFTVQSVQKPMFIVAERGSKWGSFVSPHIEKIHTILTLSLSKFENEFEIFKNYLINQFQKENKNYKVHDEIITPKNGSDAQSKPKYIIELEHLAKLRNDGVISQEDFDVKKKQLLDIK
jgi:hypothetical protein